MPLRCFIEIIEPLEAMRLRPPLAPLRFALRHDAATPPRRSRRRRRYASHDFRAFASPMRFDDITYMLYYLLPLISAAAELRHA